MKFGDDGAWGKDLGMKTMILVSVEVVQLLSSLIWGNGDKSIKFFLGNPYAFHSKIGATHNYE